ncbi:MAG: archaellar assembly protein FlaJ [Thermoplasmata archaeon]|nr:archaellar assembly protein FlaJ [Thermoplasmata archaeon]
MDRPFSDYVKRRGMPILFLSLLITAMILYFVPQVFKHPFLKYTVYSIPLFAIAVVFLLPIIEAELKRSKIDENMHLFITRMGALSTADLPRKKLFEILSRVEEYGPLSEDIGRIYVLMEYWNLSLPAAARHVAKRTPSIIFADFLERMAHAIEAGEDLHNFLVKEQEVVISEYEVLYEGALKAMDVLKEVFVSIVAASMFMIIFITLLPTMVPGETNLMIALALISFILIEAVIVYFAKVRLPKDEMWHNMSIRPDGEVKVKKVLPLTATLGFLIFSILLSVGVRNPILLLASAITPTFYPGWLIRKEEDLLRRCDDSFDAFMRAVGAAAESVGGSTESVLKQLTKHDFGALSEPIQRLYKRIATRIDKIKAWVYFSAETRSNLISKFTEMYIKALMVGGKPTEVSRIISRNFVKINGLRKHRYQTAANIGGVLYGLTVAISFTMYLSINIMKIMNNAFSSVVLPKEMYVPIVITTYNVAIMQYLAMAVIIIHTITSSLLLKVVGGNHPYTLFLNLTMMTWVAAIVSIIADYSLNILLAGG